MQQPGPREFPAVTDQKIPNSLYFGLYSSWRVSVIHMCTDCLSPARSHAADPQLPLEGLILLMLYFDAISSGPRKVAIAIISAWPAR